MKLDFKLDRKESNWFAWHPVKMKDNTFVWLDWVHRTPIYAYDSFMYYTYEHIN